MEDRDTSVVEVTEIVSTDLVPVVAATVAERLGMPVERVRKLIEARTGPITRSLRPSKACAIAEAFESAGVAVAIRTSAQEAEVRTPSVQRTRGSGVAASDVDVPYRSLHAVTIGISRYSDPRLDLSYARADAEAINQLLIDEFGFDVSLTLYDEEASRERVLTLLEDDLTRVDEDDGVVLFFAGHGVTHQDALGVDRGYLVPYDGDSERIGRLISMNHLRDQVLPTIPAKHIFMIVDACYGGLAFRDVRLAPRGVQPTARVIEQLTSKANKVRQVLTAGGRDQKVLDGGLYGRSVFTGHLIRALREASAHVLADNVAALVKERVVRDSHDRGHLQVPSFGYTAGGEGTFVFSKRRR